MGQFKSGSCVVLALLLAASVACTSKSQRSAPAEQSNPPQGVTSSARPTPASRAPVPRQAFSPTAVRAYPGGLVLVTAESDMGASRRSHLLVSTNHGATFTDITPSSERMTAATRVDDMVARGPRRIWLVAWNADSEGGTLFRTRNGGSTWTASRAPGHDAAGSTDSITFKDARHGWLMDQMPTGPVSLLFRTTNGGNHWHLINRHLPQVGAVAYNPETGLWQGSGLFNHGLTQSTDGGKTWHLVNLGSTGRTVAYSLPALFHGQMVEATSILTRKGELLRFFRRSDNGLGWMRLSQLGPLPHEPKVYGSVRRAQVAFARPNTWWVIADDPRPTVYTTVNAGLHWAAHRFPSTANTGKAAFPQIVSSGPRRAWVLVSREGGAQQLLETVDGGHTWVVAHLGQRLTTGDHVAAAWHPRCRSAQLTARIANGGAVASQPFVTVALRNHSRSVCDLGGYPRIRASGWHGYGGPVSELAIQVRRGPIYERRDPGPHRVALSHGDAASFNLGTVTAYQGGAHILTLTRLLVTPPGCSVPIAINVRMNASHPPGHPTPIGVTALQRGIPDW